MLIGPILCSDKSYGRMGILRLEEGGMCVAEHLADLPPRRLHGAIRTAREQIAVRDVVGSDSPSQSHQTFSQ